LAEVFGPGIITGGVLDRKALADLVFGDEASRLKLNGIVHPWVRREAARLLREYRDKGHMIVVQDVPLLFEGSLQDNFDAVLVVSAPLELRQERVMQRSGLSAAEFLKRDASQWPLERKAELADHVLDNSGTETGLREQVKQVWGELALLAPPT